MWDFFDFYVNNFYIFFVSIIILFIPLIFRNRFSKNQLGGIALTAGITGTFFGIFIGLLQFDTNQIEDSLPLLLEGLKTAFLTSLAGLSANLIVKIYPKIYLINEDVENDDVGEEIIKVLKLMIDESKYVSSSMFELSKSISSDKDTSLVTQLQKIRTTNSDGFDNMNESFEKFAEKVVADNTQSLIDALTDVMKDFNSKINEQFGENFKELNSAVKLMLEWQKEYKSQIDTLIQTYSSVLDNLKGIDETLASSSQNHTIILDTNKELKKIVEDFSGMIESFSDLGVSASKSLPIIENNMNAITEKSNDFINQSLSGLSSNYDDFTSKQKELSDSFNNTIENMITSNAERIKKLDEELGNELTKSIETLGSSLATLSSKFANDYGPITENFKKIIDSTNIK
jgi:DNA anti-recombination protein RmuC